jgi:hypothetical protein
MKSINIHGYRYDLQVTDQSDNEFFFIVKRWPVDGDTATIRGTRYNRGEMATGICANSYLEALSEALAAFAVGSNVATILEPCR